MSTQQSLKEKLTPEQIRQKRRQKILARAAKQQQQKQTASLLQSDQPIVTSDELKPTERLSQTNGDNQQKRQRLNEDKQQRDAFQRFRTMVAKQQKQRALIFFSKLLGFIVVSIQFYLLVITKKYETKHLNRQISDTIFNQIKQKFVDEIDLIFWSCGGILLFAWLLLKFNDKQSTNKGLNSIQILPGSTMISVMEQLNKVLEYKIVIKIILGYVCSIVVTSIVINCMIQYFGWSSSFYHIPIELSSINPSQISEDIL